MTNPQRRLLEYSPDTIEKLKPCNNTIRIQLLYGNCDMKVLYNDRALKSEKKLRDNEAHEISAADVALDVNPLVAELHKKAVDVRISDIYSTPDDDKKKTMRTFAITFPGPARLELAAADKEINEGAKIGETMKKYGWGLKKKVLYFGEIFLLNPQIMKGMQIEDVSAKATVVIYELEVYKLKATPESKTIYYATIYEVNHPDYLPMHVLEQMPEIVAAKHQAAAMVEPPFLSLIRGFIAPPPRAYLRLSHLLHQFSPIPKSNESAPAKKLVLAPEVIATTAAAPPSVLFFR